jgi:hypothetical protein
MVDSMAWFTKKKSMQKEMKGHRFDLNNAKPRIAKIARMAIMVAGGSNKPSDTEISWEMHNL